MSETRCPHCGHTLTLDSGVAFCPYCGGPLAKGAPTAESEAVSAALQKAEAMEDPVKKHALLAQTLAGHPDSLAVAEELLMLGRLHERNPHAMDFTVIKCNLLNLYLEPDAFSPVQAAAARTELFAHPDLERCLALAPDRETFLNHYLTRLSGQFIELFLRGSNRYMRRFFGFGLDGRAPKLLAYPAARMLAAMKRDEALAPEQRVMLAGAFFRAFSTQVGDTQWLSQAMAELGVTLG